MPEQIPITFEINRTNVRDVGKMISQVRESKKISQPTLAKMLKMAQPTISYMENKSYGPITGIVEYLNMLGYSMYIAPSGNGKSAKKK